MVKDYIKEITKKPSDEESEQYMFAFLIFLLLTGVVLVYLVYSVLRLA